MTQIISKTVPSKPRSGNYPTGSVVTAGGGGTVIINDGDGSNVEIVREGDNTRLSDSNVLSSLRAILEAKKAALSIIVADDKTALTDENVLSSLKAIEEIKAAIEAYDLLADKKYLSSDKPDTANELITLLKGLHVKGGADIDNLHVLETIAAKLVDAVSVSANKAEIVTAIVEHIQSSKYTAGVLGKGHSLTVDEQGRSTLVVDNIHARMEAIFNKLTIAEMQSVGGQIVLSVADMQCNKVEDRGDYYRCYFDTKDGAIPNRWAIRDQARCQTWIGNQKYYWRLVVGKGNDYIDLSKTDCDGSGIPEARDAIVQLGNRTDLARQNAIILSAYGVPSIKQYDNIHSYSLDGCEVTVIGPEGNKFTGDFSVISGEKKVRIPADLGAWNNGMACRYYDRVSHNGALWLCLVEEGKTTTDEPSDSSQVWIKQVDKGTNGKPGTDGKDGKDAGVNLLKWQEEWTLGNGDLPNWINNGAVAENERIIGNNPFGIKSIIWKCKEQGDSGGSGGWDGSYMSLDPKFAYRYCVFVYKTKNSGILLHGTHGVLNMDGVIKDNPYFYADSFPIMEWHLVVGVIHPNSATVDSGTSGLYDMSGKKISSGIDYKQRNPSVKVNFRSYNYYETNTSQVQYFYNPMLHILDGTEPSIEQILQLSARKEIDAVKTTYDKKFESTDKQFLSVLSETKTYADNAVAEIQVGGRNLVLKSYVNETSSAYGFALRSVDLIAGQEYTFSIKGRSNQVAIDEGKHLAGYLFLDDWSFSKTLIVDNVNPDIKNITFIAPKTAKYRISSYLYPSSGLRNGEVGVEWYQVEVGNKATDWTPAPEDVEADAQAKADAAQKAAELVAIEKVNLAKIETAAYADGKVSAAEARSIADAKAKLAEAQLDAQTKADKAKADALSQAAVNHPTKTEFKSSIDQLAGQISSKVSQTDYNALGERVKKAETEILQTPEAINLAVRKIAVGTRNYVSHSKYNIQENVSNVRGWGVRCWKLVDDNIFNKVLRVEADGAYIVFNRNDFKCGDYVTISLTIKGESDGSFSSQVSDGNGGNKWGDGTFSYTKEWQRVSVTIKIPQGITANSDQNFIYYPTAPVLIADVTINKGNVAAAWQLADEEMLNKDNILSSINLSEEGVKIDGKKVEITGELLAQIIKAKGLNVGNKTFIDALGNFKTVNATISGIINALSGSIGNFTIVNGDIIGVDTAKKERIRISTNPLPSLDSLITGYALLDKIPAYTADGRLSLDRVSESYYQGGDSKTIRVKLDGATSIKIVGGQGHTGYSDRSIYNPNWRLEVKPTKLTITSVVAGGLKIDNAPFDTPIPINYVGDVYITCDVQYFLYNLVAETNSPDEVCENINIPEVGIYKLGTTEKTYIGSDGFYSVFGSGEYVYFKRGVGFVTKGKTDMSGVLASGTVAANGTQTNVWGARAADGFVTKGGVGIFNVPHRVGHTKYTVTASSYNNGITVSIVSKSAYSVQLQVGANGGFYDVGFDYTIIGQN